ncbi:MAG: hypothetical protein MRZ97_05095 [Firmicutes bacterium]|nr:hypothetical protein [Bacillota bacterium]
MDRETWMEEVLHQIRFAPDRKKIRQELSEHMEDRMEEDGMSEARLLEAMGDPTELGIQLNRQHKPWLGWLWMGSWTILLITVILTAGILIFGWMDQQVEKNLTGNIDLDLERTYASMSKYYDSKYNQSGDILYHWEPDWTVTVADTDITFRKIAYDRYDGRLVVILTSRGVCSLTSNILEIHCSGEGASMAEHHTGVDEEGNRVGVHLLTYERFPQDTETAEFRYDKFGEAFAFTIDLATGEVIS